MPIAAKDGAKLGCAGGDAISAVDVGGEKNALLLLMLQSREDEVESLSFLYEMELPREPEVGRRLGPPALFGVVFVATMGGESKVWWTLIGAGRPRPIVPYPLVGEFERRGESLLTAFGEA